MCARVEKSRSFFVPSLFFFFYSRGLFDIAECSDVRTLRHHGNLPHNDTSRGEECETWDKIENNK